MSLLNILGKARTRIRPSVRAGVIAAVIATSVATAQTALACGESLYRVGKGVTYREYTAPLPGTILIIAKDEQERLLAEALQKAGHNVEVVADATGVRDRLQDGRFDIVMSRYEHSETVDSQIRDATASVKYLPVARHDTNEVLEARSRYDRALSTDDNIKTFLIQIHRTLKGRKA